MIVQTQQTYKLHICHFANYFWFYLNLYVAMRVLTLSCVCCVYVSLYTFFAKLYFIGLHIRYPMRELPLLYAMCQASLLFFIPSNAIIDVIQFALGISLCLRKWTSLKARCYWVSLLRLRICGSFEYLNHCNYWSSTLLDIHIPHDGKSISW